jgi:hypothetical protein
MKVSFMENFHCKEGIQIIIKPKHLSAVKHDLY